MKEKQKGISIKILGKEFKVNCPEGFEESLFKAAQFLDSKTQEVTNNNNIVSFDKVVVMAALNIVNDYLELKTSQNNNKIELDQKLLKLQDKIDKALGCKEY